MQKRNGKKLVLLDTDTVQLKKLLHDKASECHQYCSALKEEIQKAQIVPQEKLPPDVVTMHSTVEILDMEDDEISKYTLVYPWEADADSSKISILAPIGTAILGYRLNDEISWKVPSGLRTLKISSVTQSQQQAA